MNLDGRYRGGRSGGCDGPHCGTTDDDGRYTIAAPPGTYRPIFYNYQGGWAPEWARDAQTKALATPVLLTSGRDIRLDATLEQGGTIRGSVVEADGSLPTDYVVGGVYTEDGDSIGDFDAYSGNGWTFTSSALPPGRLLLRADLLDEETGESTTSWFDGASTEKSATLVPLSKGEVKDIVFHLPGE